MYDEFVALLLIFTIISMHYHPSMLFNVQLLVRGNNLENSPACVFPVNK